MANELQSDTFQGIQDQMREQVTRVINALYGGGGGGASQQGSASSSITPAADVIEDDTGYRLTFDVPGVDQRNLEVNVTGNTLSLRAQRDTEVTQALREQQNQQGQQGGQQQRRQHILLTERRIGTFRREFRLPEDADRNRINADLRNGVLTLTVGRSQDSQQRRRIEIKNA